MTATKSITLTDVNLNDLAAYYQDFKVIVTQPGVAALFILPNCRITAYNSGKILFQGKDAGQVAARWQNTHLMTAHKPNPMVYIGCDETGVGDYFAPLVTSACYVTPTIKHTVNHLKIQDSKQLTDDYIQNIAAEIKQLVPHVVMHLSNKHYNQLIDHGFNAHAIKAFAHNKTITQLIEQYNIETNITIVMDQFASADNYRKYLQGIEPLYIPTIFETKAENKYAGVACASILARNHFLGLIQKQNNLFDCKFPLGASKKVDIFGRSFLSTHGMNIFKDLVKWHFSNTNRIISNN